MADENTKPVVIRTQVYLSDPDYFCNKSWTMSYNLNTKSWISYHSYIPNFYIGENNFFYSGLNGCCDDNQAGGFEAIAGVIDKTPPLTTTTTTFYPSPSTTTTTTTLSCILNGRIYQTDCILEGEAVITVYPTTTTTVCVRLPLHVPVMCPPTAIYVPDMCPPTAIYVSSYCYVSSNYYACVLMRVKRPTHAYVLHAPGYCENSVMSAPLSSFESSMAITCR